MPSPRPSSEDRIRAALWFAERGFGVFSVWSTDADGTCRCAKGRACESAGKHPVPGIGFKAATTDPARIRTMLSIPSDPNYGMLPPEGVFALDVDGDGVARLAEIEARYGPLPPTLRTSTAHGQHVFLRWPDALPRPIGQLFGYVTRWGSGRDAGYVIGPRSVHASGAIYSPVSGTLAIAELPEAWARAAVSAPVTSDPTTITVTGGYAMPDLVPAGAARYPEIVRYTAHLYDTSRLSVAEMWPLVRDVLAPRFADPLTETELRDRFERAVANIDARLGERRHVPPAPVDPAAFPPPENRGLATLSDLGEVEYVDDLVRPGRIVVWAAEEGSGKSFAVSGELAIRVAAAGGTFAGTWPVIQRGRVLVLSEMHPDDDYLREEMILGSLDLDRRALDGTYFRLDLMAAAGGKPALTVPEWRDWITGWLAEHEAILLILDTATGATQVDPWGHAIQEVYANLRLMLARDPVLAVILIVHVRKPAASGAGGRGLSDVLGEWGRWCDVVVLQENDGKSLDRAKLTTRKRVRHQRRIVATKAGGLLIDAVDLDGIANAKVPATDVLAAIEAHPGATFAELGTVLGVAKDTAKRYVARLGDRVAVVPMGPRREFRVYPADDASNDRSTAPHAADAAVRSTEPAPPHRDASDPSNSTPTPTAARRTATHGSGAAVVSEGADRSIRPPHLKVGEVRRSDAAASPHRGSTHRVGASEAGIARRPDGSVWCHCFRDHQTRHENVNSDPRCPTCSPEEDPA